ncbi:hypothetical protein HZ994_17335 [Akkermansiaceae bacterium]|nr:hypothetical protein HZ994_17335 [Akkermansiaceae bacterium]
MKITIPLALILLAHPSMAGADDAVVRFSNGDQLTGEVLSITGDRLSIKSQVLDGDAEFDTGNIIDLSMADGGALAPDAGATHRAVLEMTNGDRIEGRLAGLGDEEIKIATPYAGELTIRRVNVQSIDISRVSDSHYRGPNSLEEWQAGKQNGSWQFKAGALHSSSPGAIAREIEFPEECVIGFDASWRGSFRPKIIFFSDDTSTSDPKVGYEMVFQGNSVHVKKSGSNNWLGHSTNAAKLRENEKARIEIKASKKTGKILLYVDGEIADLWQDADFAGTKFGMGLHIVAQDSSPLRISNITVTGWDGYHEEVPERQMGFQGRVFRGGMEMRLGLGGEDPGEEEEDSSEKLPDGRMLLVNGDSIEGEVLKVEGEDITVKTPFTEVTFPIARLKNIALKKADMETVKLYAADVRATFADGSRLVFRFDGVDGDNIIGFSQHFGQARFSRDAFRRIEFNIHNRAMDSMRQGDGW